MKKQLMLSEILRLPNLSEEYKKDLVDAFKWEHLPEFYRETHPELMPKLIREKLSKR